MAAPVSQPTVEYVPLPVAAVQTLAELERYVRAIALEIPAVSWNVYSDGLDADLREQLARDLVAVRNRYEYAVKMKDEERIPGCVHSLRVIADEYGAQDALQIAGCMMWQLGRHELARDLFAEAADALNDGLSCFDLAMAQRATDEREYAPGTLRNCLNEDSAPRSVALTALTAIVLKENTGRAELAGLVQDAAQWRPGPARLAVLHCGLVCVSKADLVGFPVEQWDSPDAAPEAFATLARTLHARPAPAAARSSAPLRPQRPAASVAKVVSAAGLPATVRALAVEVHACLNRKDIPAAEEAFQRLKALAPLDAQTWSAERALSNARNRGAAGPAPTPSRVPARKSPAKPALSSSRGTGPYARAEEEFHQDNFEAAEQYFKLAIANRDNPTRAVRRLVNMLSTRLKRREDALAVLDENKHFFRTATELWGWSQDRSTVLEHAGRWEEAIGELTSMLSSAPTKDDRVRVVKRMAAALLKESRRQDAKELLERELRRNPRQRSLETLLEQVNTAMETGIWSDVEISLQLQAEATTDLSPLLTFHLERCEYWGVPAESRARREFTEDDIKRVDNLVSGRARTRLLGTDLPRERAEANLSAARIMQDLGITDDGFRKRLRYFAAAMGDACALEAKVTVDVIRAYYSEAVSVKADWDDTADFKLRQLVMSFTLTNVQLLEDRKVPPLEEALAQVMAQKLLAPKVLGALLALPTQGEIAARLISRIWADRVTREQFQQALATHLGRSAPLNDRSAFTEAWKAAAEQDRSRRRVYRQITSLSEAGPALPALDRHSGELNEIQIEMRDLASATDLARIVGCQQIVSNLRQYSAQTTYVERERLYSSVRMSIRDLVTELETAPTVLSVETLLPYLRALDHDVEMDFAQYAAKAAPESLKVEVVLDRYLPGAGEVTVQIQVSNGADASPVSNVELEVVHTADYTAAKDVVWVAESIGAGESRTCQIALMATPAAIEQELLTLHCRVRFILRSQNQITAPVEPKSIRLHHDAEWVEIVNPYAAGLPVEDRRMFKGRDQLIGELVETVADSRGSVVVYGQKRAGKSSVLFHLKEAFTQPNLAVNFSIQDLTGTVSFADLLYKIGREFYETLSERIEDEGLAAEPPPEPDLLEIRMAELPKFIEYMRALQRWLKRVPGLADSELILLLDEFTVIHKEIQANHLPADFMKGWKALLEKGFFRCVLVGNDLMPRFIQDYPNEFQVALQKRVSYLDPMYARALIEDPIRLPDDQSRYRGNAVDRILALTGCSPYYIQLFCHDLVEYMNREDVRAPAIGPADVDTVAKNLINDLDESHFDNLLTPGDRDVTNISEALVIDVLRATHREAGAQMYHEINPGALGSHPDAELVIQDLLRREVLKRIPGNRYRIQVGLFSEWLQHQWA